MAANVILGEFEKNNQRINLIYNSYKDKDYKKVLETLKPIIDEIEIIDIDDNRMVEKKEICKICDSLKLKYKDFDIINMKKDKNYLVFGSFLVVENFLKDFKVER